MMNSKPTVCHIDSEPMVRQVVAATLAQQYEVVSFQNYQEFLSSNAKPDVILLEIGYDFDRQPGWQFIATLKTQRKYQRVPILLLTFLSPDLWQSHSARASVVAFLQKPSNAGQLRLLIEGVCGSLKKQ